MERSIATRYPLVLSLILHGGLVSALAYLNFGARAVAPEYVSVVTSHGPRFGAASTAEKRASRRSRHRVSAPAVKARPAVASSATRPRDVPDAGSKPEGGGEEGGAVARENYQAELRAAIEARKEYPPIARARHQQGQVIVGFVLRKDGEIDGVHLVSGSRYQRLNDAAVATVQSLGKFKPVPDEVSKGDWTLVVAMNYVLD